MSQGLKEKQGWVVADKVVFVGVELAWSDGAVGLQQAEVVLCGGSP